MRASRLSAVLIGAGAVLALGGSWGTASAAVGHPEVLAAATAAGAHGPHAGTWGKAVEVPGSAALNTGGNAVINSVSCASSGDCGAGGSYSGTQAFVVNETNGTWGKAEEVPGTAALNQGALAQVSQVSCASAGNCGAGGYYTDSSGNDQGFVVNEINGTWGTAEEVPGFPALGAEASVDVLSCGSAGNCSAGGNYSDSSGNFQAFVVNEINGTWGTAEEVPGIAALNQGEDAHVGALSCASAGNCSAAGTYFDSAGNTQVFVVNEINGTWGTAEEVPGTAALNKGGIFGTQIFSVSCPAAGDCAAVGYYTNGSGSLVPFAVNETSGIWGTAGQISGVADQGFGQPLSVSCASVGNCVATGDYSDSSGYGQAFVVNETDGTWGASEEVPGSAALNKGGNAVGNSVSCASAGNCAVVGNYNAGSGDTEVFAVNETNGTWGTAEEVPGTATLNKGRNAVANSVSCAPAGNCSAGGSYSDGSFRIQAFVVSEP